MAKNSLVIIGGGSSIREGISLGLWDKLISHNIWSVNYAFLTMPYPPMGEVWIDTTFFTKNIDKLQELSQKGVKCYSKSHPKYANIPEIKTFNITRNIKESIERGNVYIGQMGLGGFFALSVAVFKEKIYKTIYLLGYDFGSIANDNITHFYQNEIMVDSVGIGHPELYRENGKVSNQVKDFEIFNSNTDVKIYNVSPKSAIECFEKITYEQFFKLIENE